MQTLDPSFSVIADLDRREVHFSAAGFWDQNTLAEFSRELLEKAKPFYSQGRKMYVLGDLTGFVTQTREIAEGIRLVVSESARLGVVRTAIVTDSQLAAMQYKRINDGINLEIFETKADALDWLRSKEAA
ncbi:hypothetical protein NAP1_07625 [Erythrobacter sp. NAP1]|uniref:STAS/SEC14 domain-containing protein n=1 Tax=Erythrobacter sp. NAP1 TaxID=237727 RepID=UPI0000686955|nr:STAS/SEC14 domain-containing protein [Erythrobacter sp. NAP1]EAQ30631.1 hypothetical protein NAP1_07625 [Erythrobacter sp. NAP1]